MLSPGAFGYYRQMTPSFCWRRMAVLGSVHIRLALRGAADTSSSYWD
jgi:hypothetical protein